MLCMLVGILGWKHFFVVGVVKVYNMHCHLVLQEGSEHSKEISVNLSQWSVWLRW